VMLITLSSLLILLTSTIVVNKITSDKKDLKTRVMYTTKVAFSHSAVAGDVVSVMSSTDKKKSFILLHMADMTLLPADANDYTVFVTGASSKQKKQKLKSGVSGTLYVFGTTGYYGIYLMNNEPFPNQILDIIVRNNEDVSGLENGVADVTGVGAGGSFKKFDQMQLYVNPGADGGQIAKFLDAPELDMSKMYKEAIIVPQEQTFFDNVTFEYRLSPTSNKYLNLFYQRDSYDWLEGNVSRFGGGFMWRRKLKRLKDLFNFRDDADEIVEAAPDSTKKITTKP